MENAKGVLEMDLNGKILSKSGEFETEPEDSLNKISKNIFYILQDIHNIKNKNQSFGNYQKMTIKSDNTQYEIAVGASAIKVFKFNKS